MMYHIVTANLLNANVEFAFTNIFVFTIPFRLFCVIVKTVTIIWIYNIICSSDVWRLYNEV